MTEATTLTMDDDTESLKAHNRPIRVRDTVGDMAEVTFLDNETYGVVYTDAIETGDVV